MATPRSLKTSRMKSERNRLSVETSDHAQLRLAGKELTHREGRQSRDGRPKRDGRRSCDGRPSLNYFPKLATSRCLRTVFTADARSEETCAPGFDEMCRPSVAPLFFTSRLPDSPIDLNSPCSCFLACWSSV